MANVNWKLVGGYRPKEEEEKKPLSKEEIDALYKEWHQLIELPTDEFLSDEVQTRLDYIHKQIMLYIKSL